MIIALQPYSRAVVIARAAKLAASHTGGGVPAPQPGGDDHWRRQRRADGRGQRVQPADRDLLARDLGVAEPGALLPLPVDPLLHRVDIDEPEHLLAGQQRRPPGEP